MGRTELESTRGNERLEAEDIVFGTGPVGQAVTRTLLAENRRVRLYSKSGVAPKAFLSSLDASQRNLLATGGLDLFDRERLLGEVRGAKRLYHCVNTPYQEWESSLERIQDGLVAVAIKEKAVLVVADNLYGFARGLPKIDVDSPIDPPSRKGRLRVRLHEGLLEASARDGLRFTTVRASDYYGPGVTWQGVFGSRLFLDPLSRGRRPSLVGNPDMPHSYSHVGDFGRALVRAAFDDRARGRAWILPNDKTRTTREVATLFARKAGKEPRFMRIPRAGLAFVGVFDPLIRELLEVLYQKEEAYVVDGRHFAETFSFSPTPLEAGIEETLAWHRGVASA